MKTRLIFITLLSLILASCSFQLRGWHSSAELPFDEIYIDTAQDQYNPLLRQITQRLASYDVKVVERSNEAPVTLRIISDNFQNIDETTAASADQHAYRLIYTVQLQLFDQQGSKITDVESIAAQINYTSNPNQVYGFSGEEALLHNDLRQDMTTRIVNYLTSNRITSLIDEHSNQQL